MKAAWRSPSESRCLPTKARQIYLPQRAARKSTASSRVNLTKLQAVALKKAAAFQPKRSCFSMSVGGRLIEARESVWIK
jgi:hypothetical protein